MSNRPQYRLKLWRDPNDLTGSAVVTPYSLITGPGGEVSYAVPSNMTFAVMQPGEVIPECAKLPIPVDALEDIRKDLDAILGPPPLPADVVQRYEEMAKELDALREENKIMKQEIYEVGEEAKKVLATLPTATAVDVVPQGFEDRLAALETAYWDMKKVIADMAASAPAKKRSRKPKEKPTEQQKEEGPGAEAQAAEIAEQVSGGEQAEAQPVGGQGTAFDPFKVG